MKIRLHFRLTSWWVRWTALAATLIHSASAAPNFDLRSKPEARAPLTQVEAEAALQSRLPGVSVARDPVVGAPRFIRAARGFLTGPGGEGITVSPLRVRALPAEDPARAAKAFVAEHRALFGHGPEALAAARITRDYTDAHNGLRTLVWQQQLDGIPVFEAMFKAHITRRGELVNLGSAFLPDLAAAAGKNAVARAADIAEPKISAAKAVSVAAAGAGEQVAPENVAPVAAVAGADQHRKLTAAQLSDLEARLVWLPMDAATLRLCWQVVFTSLARREMFLVLVDAESGQALVRHGLTSHLSDASYRVFTSDSPSPFSPGHPTPNAAQPPLVARTLVTLAALDATASPNGWIDDGGTQTLGNNVHAHTDLNSNNLPDLPRPTNANRVFDFPLDLTQAPNTYYAALVTDLFYWINLLHDRYYQLGFTEAAGNFQTNNFGRGGAGNDAVQADVEALVASNADFSTPPDGSPGRMQLFVYGGPQPDRHVALDHEIVIHEYTHGLSTRLVGGGVGISAEVSRGLAEGWSDFYAICLLAEPGDDPNGTYARGAYANFQNEGLTENYYYGARRYPISTDLLKNPLTFKDIDVRQASPHAGVPRSPRHGAVSSAVHAVGEVWCVTLWEARARLVAAHGFAGNQLMLQLVTDGLKLAPANPNFLEARDAILQADQVLTGGANRDHLWAAFARRGMGDEATAFPDSPIGVSESFLLPDDLQILPVTGLVSRGPTGGPFQPTSITYTLRNRGAAPLNWSAVNAQPWLTLSASGGTLAAGASTPVVASLASQANALPRDLHSDVVTFTNTTSAAVRSRPVYLAVALEFLTELFAGPPSDSNDTAGASYLFLPDATASGYLPTRVPAAAFLTDPSGGSALTLSDDSFSEVILSGGAQVMLFGVSYETFFVGSNGYVTLGGGDSGFTQTIARHFTRPGISALRSDLNPAVGGGSVSVRQLSNRVAVTWQNVPQVGSPGANNFQIEMFFDGRITITILGIGATDGLIGLSAGGGTPANFFESDFSAFANAFDRLPSWRALHDLPGDGSQDLAAPAGDGIANLLKYALHLAPRIGDLLRPNNRPLPNPAGTTLAELSGLPVAGRNAEGRLTFVYARRKASSTPGISYAVEFSDLTTPFAENAAASTAVLPLDATWERVTVTDSMAAPGVRAARLRITVEP